MNFYIFTRLPVALISGLIGLLANFSTVRQLGELSSKGRNILLVMLVGEVIYYGLSFITYKNMKKTKPLGFYLNFLVLLLDCVAIGAGNALQGGLQMGITSGLIAAAIWLVPNFIYFIKRREMFYIPEQKDVLEDALHQMMMGVMPQGKEGEFFPVDGRVNPFEQPLVVQPVDNQLTEEKPQPKAEEIRSDLYTYCPYCGEVIEKEAKVCSHCHHELEQDE